MGLLKQVFSPAQVMIHHKTHVKEMVGKWTCDLKQLYFPIQCEKLGKKKPKELWHKHHKDLINVRIWVLENHDSIFYNVQHALLDLNSQTQYHTSFTLGIQISWQLQIMQKFVHGSLISFDAIFGMPFFLLYEMPQN
jgi:hypothetical protein